MSDKNDTEQKTAEQLAREAAENVGVLTEMVQCGPEIVPIFDTKKATAIILSAITRATADKDRRIAELEADHHELNQIKRQLDKTRAVIGVSATSFFIEVEKKVEEMSGDFDALRAKKIEQYKKLKDAQSENDTLRKQVAQKDEALKKAFILIDTEYTFRRHSPIWEMLHGSDIRDTVKQALSATPADFVSGEEAK